MGSVEGDILIQPITGNYLFNPNKSQVAAMDPRSGKSFSQAHPPYTDETLAQAIVSGIDVNGKNIQAMMPTYVLSPEDLAGLTAYLKQLSISLSPGVEEKVIHLATVIAPGIEPKRQQVFVDMLKRAVQQKNGSTATARGLRRHMTLAAQMVLGTERTWTLDFWELQGTPETWSKQLDEKLAQKPVFALVSGLSDTTWQPVHEFCQRQRVPCWFPSIPLPPADDSFYSPYFSQGVELEAKALAKYLTGDAKYKPKQLIQLHGSDFASAGAASALAAALGSSGIKLEEKLIKDDSPKAFSEALSAVKSGVTAVVWADPAKLGKLGSVKAPKGGAVYFSAVLAHGEKGIPDALKPFATLVYPYEMPDKRQTNLAYFHQWLKMKRIPLIDEPMQSEAFVALDYLTDTQSEMLGNVYRDYLLERAENMLSRREQEKAEQQTREREMYRRNWVQGPQGGTSIYPRLGLGVGQRFASKGVYLTHFAKDGRLVADSDWIVP